MRNNVWLIGGAPAIGDLDGIINFINGAPNGDTLINAKMPLFITDADICDTTGQILFYSNGIWVANRNDDTMQNGYGVTSGFGASYWESSGTLILQGALILPIPDHPTEYYLFAVNADDSISFRPKRLVYSKIDMTLDSGLGSVTEKNISIIEDTLTNGRITACRHADGKSWWLIDHETGSKKYYEWLITADSILGPYSQVIGSNYGTGFIDVGGQSCFSQDGRKFATFGTNFKLDFMDFDRCSGQFSNCKTIHFYQGIPGEIGLGCCFSPNGRFIYANTQTRLWQVDLDTDSQHSIDTVGIYDGFIDPFATLFGQAQLAPDGKIYLGEWNGNLSMHVINAPDKKGDSCDFTQHSFHIPVYDGVVPNFVNYDLGPLKIYEADAGVNKYISSGDTVMIGILPIDSLIYQWSPASSLSNSIIAQPLAFPDTTTKYYLTIVDTTDTVYCNQRIDSMIVYVDEYPASTPTVSSQATLQIFPNPATATLQLNLPALSSLQQLKVINAFGEIVKEESLIHKTGNKISVNISNLPSGVYFVELQTEKGKAIRKFVKQ